MRIVVAMLAGVLALFLPAPAGAQTADLAPQAQVRELHRLLNEPRVRGWLTEELKKRPDDRPAGLEYFVSSPAPERLASTQGRLDGLAAADPFSDRLVTGALSAVLILLVTDLFWQVFKRLIDRRLAAALAGTQLDPGAAAHEAQLRTLLPSFRNLGLVVLGVSMALWAMGVESGPLIVGAIVVGLAIGAGAQMLLRDVISGIFYLHDDAFRIGEYIESGNYKGTVESYSLRSVRLRDHRGPIYTVPFGQLGAVGNMSRDWVIDNMAIRISYDSDIELARKLVEKIGKELATDPEFVAYIVEPLNMQGVDQSGHYAIQLRLEMMTKPNEQFVIHRRALAMIKQTFKECGIKLAV